MKLNPTFLEIVLLLVISLAITLWVRYEKRLRRWWKDRWKTHRKAAESEAAFIRSLPALCGGIVASALTSPVGRGALGRGKRSGWEEEAGRHERLRACMNRKCRYFRISDPAIYVLVSDGKRGAGRTPISQSVLSICLGKLTSEKQPEQSA